MTYPALAFAVPGDITTVTGGYIYDRRLLSGLRDLGHDVHHIELPASFPNPAEDDIVRTTNLLNEVGDSTAIIVDGLAFGSLPTATLTQTKAPLIALIHHPLAKESGIGEEHQKRLYETERANLALAQHVLVPSSHTAAILISEYGVTPSKLTVIRPGSDRPKTAQEKADPPLILSVGIQAPRKGHDVLLRALSKIKKVPWQAVIVGSEHDADHATYLQLLKAELGLGDRVVFTGQVSPEKLSDLYGQASIFALATRYEGYGIVFDEAQVNGLPIVSCATGAVPDTVPPATGLLVPIDAPDMFAQALGRVLSDTHLRAEMTAAARIASRSFPSWDDTARCASDAIKRALLKGPKNDS